MLVSPLNAVLVISMDIDASSFFVSFDGCLHPTQTKREANISRAEDLPKTLM
jgi:hypothetical protein